MSDSKQPLTRGDVLSALHDVYNQLDGLLDQLNETKLIEPRVFDGWTIKDVLAHLAAWERLEIGWMEAVLRDETPLLYAPGFEWDESDWRKRVDAIDRFNAHILEESKGRSLDAVLAEFRTVQQRMLELMSQVPEHSLTEPGVFFWLAVETQREPWTPIPVNSYEHYFQHIRLIHAWMEGQEA